MRLFWLVALTLVLTAGGVLAQRRFFLIATGPSGGPDFSVAEALAAVISHPPGLRRCDVIGACGPEGLIASARTSSGDITNVLDVNAGRVNSALVPADVVADALSGTGAFRKSGRQRDIRIIADLFPEVVHLVALKSARITSVSALADKTVSLGSAHSETLTIARTVLRAWHLPSWRLRERFMSSEVSAEALRQGKIDAAFFVGNAPGGLVTSLLESGKAVLVPIEGKGRLRLLNMAPYMEPTVVPEGTYLHIGAVPTVSVPTVWVVNAHEPDDVVHALTRAIFNPANRAVLGAGAPGLKFFRVDQATIALPAPLHPGAARFYLQMGTLAPIPVPRPAPAARP